MGAQLSAQQQAGLQQQVEVKGQHGEGLQQQQQLLEQGLTGPQRRGQEAPGVVVGRHHVCRDTFRTEMKSAAAETGGGQSSGAEALLSEFISTAA